jgi:hypothetical protein
MPYHIATAPYLAVVAYGYDDGDTGGLIFGSILFTHRTYHGFLRLCGDVALSGNKV